MLPFVRSFFTPAARTAASNLAWLTFWMLGAHACGLATVVLLTDRLDRAEFGVFSFAIGFQALLYMLGCAGAKQTTVRLGVARPERLDELLTAYIFLTGLCSLSGLAIALGYALAWAPTAAEGALIGLLACGNVFNCLSLIPFFDLQGRPSRTAKFTFFAEIAALSLLFAAAASQRLSLPLIGGVFAAKWIAASLTGYVNYHFTVRPVRFAASWSEFARLAQSSWPMLISSLLIMAPLASGVFFVRTFRGESETAIFGLAQQVAAVYLALAALGVRIVQPHIAGRHGMTARFLRQLAAFCVLFFGGLALALWLGALAATQWLLPAGYEAALGPALLMLLGGGLVAVGRVAAMYLLVRGRERWDAICQLVAVVFFFGASALWTPSLGSYGPAAAHLLSGALAALLAAAGALGRPAEVPRGGEARQAAAQALGETQP